MDWNCTLTEERLSEHLDGALLPEEAAAFSAHAAACSRCTRLVAQVGGLVSQMRHAALVEPPAALVENILVATLGPRKQKAPSQGWFGWLPLIWQPRFAIGIATVAASAVIVLHAAGPWAGNSNLKPLNLFRGANRQVHLTYARGAKFVNDLRVVYEIQSRLSSQPENISQPISEPATKPSDESKPGQDRQQTSPGSREKSQTIPHSNRRAHDASEFAMLLTTGLTDTFSHDSLRSLL